MSTAIPHQITPNAILVYLAGEGLCTVRIDEPTFEPLRDAIRNQRWDEIPALFSTAAAIESFSDGEITVEYGEIFYRGHVVHGAVVDKILELMEEGFDVSPLTRFLARVQNNPSIDAREELYLFCEANGFLINEDGFIIAYKAVRDNYKDIHSGTMDNSVGKVVNMERRDVTADRNITCSHGLHFAAYDYAANSFGGSRADRRLMVIAVDPADVVSIPTDYNNQKGRACRYRVIDEIGNKKPLAKKTFSRDDFAVKTSPVVKVQPAPTTSDVDDVTREDMLDALDECNWIVAGPNGAAQALDIHESSFRRRMKRFGITR